MYTVTVSRQGTPIKTVSIKAQDALAAIKVVEADYPPQTVILEGKRFTYHGVEFVARRVN